MPEMIDGFSRDRIPFYRILQDYRWVDDYLKLEALKPEMEKINSEIRRIKKMDRSKDTAIEKARVAFALHKEKRLDWLARRFTIVRNADNPFLYFTRDAAGVNRFQPYIEWDEIEQAIQRLPGAGVSDEKRAEMLAEAEKSKAALEKKILKLCPKKWFLVNDAKIIVDCRESLSSWWWRLQRKVNAPCNPRGLVLSESPQVEQAAWSDLGLHEAINSRGKNPFVGR